jgi:hypothetical protein
MVDTADTILNGISEDDLWPANFTLTEIEGNRATSYYLFKY